MRRSGSPVHQANEFQTSFLEKLLLRRMRLGLQLDELENDFLGRLVGGASCAVLGGRAGTLCCPKRELALYEPPGCFFRGDHGTRIEQRPCHRKPFTPRVRELDISVRVAGAWTVQSTLSGRGSRAEQGRAHRVNASRQVLHREARWPKKTRRQGDPEEGRVHRKSWAHARATALGGHMSGDRQAAQGWSTPEFPLREGTTRNHAGGC